MDVTSSTNYEEAIRACELGQRFLQEKEYERAIRYLRRAYTLHQPPIPNVHSLLIQAENELRLSPLYCHNCYRYRNNCVCNNGPSIGVSASSESTPSTTTSSPAPSSNSSSFFTGFPFASQFSTPSPSNIPNPHGPVVTNFSLSSILSSPIFDNINKFIDHINNKLVYVYTQWINFWTPIFRSIGFTSPDRIVLFIQGFTILLILGCIRLYLGHGILVNPYSSSSPSSTSKLSSSSVPSSTTNSLDDSAPSVHTPLESRTTIPLSRRSIHSPFSSYGDLHYSHTFYNGYNVQFYSPFGSMFTTMIIVNVIAYFFRRQQRQQ